MAQDIYLPESKKTSTTGLHAKYTIDYTDVIKMATATGGGTNTVVLEYLPQGAIVTFTRIKNVTAWTGVTTMTARVTDGTNAGTASVPVITTVNSYCSLGAMTLGTAVATPAVEGTGLFTDIDGAKPTYGTTVSLGVLFTATTGNATSLTAGSLDVWFDYIIL